jgi:hypothetical protein
MDAHVWRTNLEGNGSGLIQDAAPVFAYGSLGTPNAPVEELDASSS